MGTSVESAQTPMPLDHWQSSCRAQNRGGLSQPETIRVVERRSRVHVEVWAHGERLDILKRCMEVTTEKYKAPCDTFTTIGRCHNLDTKGQRATKEKCRTVDCTRWKKDLKVRGS